jgi:hypothetical protein
MTLVREAGLVSLPVFVLYVPARGGCPASLVVWVDRWQSEGLGNQAYLGADLCGGPVT